VGVVYDNLSRCEFYLNHFKSAAKYAQQAQSHFNLNSENYCIALEQELYALFYGGDYEAAESAAQKMLHSAARKELGEFRFAKYNFLYACLLFKQGRYKQIPPILSKRLEISKDKAGWEIGIRVLSIMAYIEMQKLNEAGVATERLRKFIEFMNKKNPAARRDKIILKLLIETEREGFTFAPPSAKAKKYLSALSGKNKKLRWEPFTHEVIPFHEWVAGKKTATPFLKGERQRVQ
jgi:tetratricopeptide (TPR) repeat protein